MKTTKSHSIDKSSFLFSVSRPRFCCSLSKKWIVFQYMCKLLCLLSLCCLSLSAFASFEEYFQRIEQAEQSVNEL
ncbi:hypothetical protein, partial [uncultured Akkermansia sp.]|uniref:hypothetical protein n=1 Tax=uncultured Akkermansia sp. TaxID=512294 RepID=UPI002638830F